MNLSSPEQILVRLIRPTVSDESAWLEGDLSRSDWQRLVQQATEHRLAPLLHHVLSSTDSKTQVPEDILSALRFEWMKTNVTNLLVYRQLDAVLERFQQEQIETILLKGGALASALYSDMSLRPMCDLDVLVPQSKLARACEIMKDAGYPAFLEPNAAFQRDFRNVVGFAPPQPGHVPVEVHWHLFHIPYYRQHVAMEWFWQRTQTIHVSHRAVLIFAPTAQLLHLTSHLVLRHQDSGLGWLYDIALLVKRYGEQIAWHELAEASTTFKLRQVLQTALRDVEQVWGTSVPVAGKDAIARLNPSMGERWIVAMNTARHVDAQEVWHVANLNTWRQRLVYLRHTLFPGSAYMQERYHISNARLIPFYHLWRLGKGLFMVARSVVSIGWNTVKRQFHSVN